MKEYLESMNGLKKIEVKDIAINLDEFKLENMSNVDKEHIFYTGKFRGPIRESITAVEYAHRALSKGYGIYCNDVVYYEEKLQTDVFNIKIDELKKSIAKITNHRNNSDYKFKEYLIDQRYYPLIENYITMYKNKMRDREWIKKKLVGKVSNIEKVLSIHFPFDI